MKAARYVWLAVGAGLVLVLAVVATVGAVGETPLNLDPSFDDDGIVVTDFGTGDYDVGEALALQDDGKIVVAGRSGTLPSALDFAVARYESDGFLDGTFGNGGLVTTDVDGERNRGEGVFVQSDDKIVVVGASGAAFTALRYTTSGALDSSFSGDGVATITVASVFDAASCGALQPDEKVLVGGTAWSGSYDFALVRFNDNGDMDATFGSGGITTTELGFDDFAHAVTVQPDDGKIILAGRSQLAAGNDAIAVARYLKDGRLDTTWGGDGIVTTDVTGDSDRANGVAVLPDGKIVVAGFGGSDVAVVRYHDDGKLDTSFGGDGIVTTTVAGDSSVAEAIAIQSDGKIVVTGRRRLSLGGDLVIVRYNTDGSLDTGVDGDGILILPLSRGDDAGKGVAIDNGKIVVAGYVENGDSDFAMVRTLKDGRLDVGFGYDGVVSTDFGGDDDDYGRAIAVQLDGKLVVTGKSGGSDEHGFAVARYLESGDLDFTFGDRGLTTTVLGGDDTSGSAVAILPDGRIVVAGRSGDYGATMFTVVRYTAEGEADVTFTSNGVVTATAGSSHNWAEGVAVQADGKTVVAGTAAIDTYDFALMRLSTGGCPDDGFAGGGITTTDLGGWDFGHAMALQPDGKILVAGRTNVGGDDDFALVRYQDDGDLDPSFGSGGVVTTHVSSGYDAIRALALQPDGKIVAAGTVDGNQLALARYTGDGALDASFGAGGVVTVALDFKASAHAVAVEPSGRIVAAGTVETEDSDDFVAVRFRSDGMPDDLFDGDGVAIVSIGRKHDRGSGLALQSDGRAVVVGSTFNGSDSDIALVRFLSDRTLYLPLVVQDD